ncbi:CocE/NonD family hydrolase [Levilactobacillus brevis]|uniref:CocE/NonD family hydrolase n=1 Tax=Levilactobacillus brevis TaxID=1580 RepID=UPI0020CB92B1|nr:CocE/NonD family hydrolase [Levilactobacillus brevis]MCP9613179.1 CocE/NonD family hydrolase [Levilactobacillus brevis]
MNEEEYKDYVETFLNGIRDAGLPQKYEKPVFKDFMVTMNDGTMLKTFAFLPDKNGSWPTIVQRGPYAEQAPLNKIIGQEVAKLGFAYVFQFCRGIGGSEGVWEPRVNERKDGLDFVNWLNDQDWVASMGFYGTSYLALTGWAIADQVPAKMKTMYLSNYGMHNDISNFEAGLTKPDILTGWAMDNAGFKVDADFMASAKHLPQYTVDVDLWGKQIDWYRDVLKSPKSSDHYWSTGAVAELARIPSRVKIPLFVSDSWYDHHFENAMTTFEQLPEATRQQSVLQIGAWNHFMEKAVFGRPTNQLLRSEMTAMLDWFNKILIKQEQPIGKMLTYEVGSDEWHETNWSTRTNSQKMTWFLDFSNHVSKLSHNVPQASGQVSYIYDPSDPVESMGGEALLHTLAKGGSQEQLPIDNRPDIISFVSQPLLKDTHLNGVIDVNLNVASTAKDTEFVVKISSVLPNGKTYNIRTQATTIAANTDNYVPKSVTKINLQTWPISYFLPKGSRIRLDITSSDFPQFQIHTNYPGNQSLQSEMQVAKQTIVSDSDNVSSITINTTKS